METMQSGQRLGTIHAGNRYLFGYGDDFYGIWDRGSEQVVDRFPATAEGRAEAWKRYLEREPTAQDAHAADPVTRATIAQQEAGGERSRRGLVVGVAILVIAGVVVGVLVTRKSGGGGGGPAAAGGGPTGSHLSITGGATIDDDLQQRKYDSSGIEALASTVSAEWEGKQVDLKIEFDSPRTGFAAETSSITGVVLDLQILGATPLSFHSINGECTITLDELSVSKTSGTFKCTELKATASDETIQVAGSFVATG